MSQVECALRLSGVPGLSSSQRLEMMSKLLDFTTPAARQLATLGLSAMQQRAFLDYDADVIVQSFRWLESPLHHF
ncbi:DNA protecting protein [Erwinia amylovora MR1]|nr:DNA protecting protein [Erwinia amylovora MR1]